MNYKGESGSYEILHPKNVSDISLASQELQELFDLSNENTVDDAFEYVSRQLILMKYNKAGINVTVKSAGGSPLEGVPIPNITTNYDGTGEVVTDSQGKAFGYCDAGSISIAPVNCADVTYTNQSVQTLAGEMYDVEITGTVVNFQKYTSSTSVRFSKNVESVDITVVGGGQAGGNAYMISGAGGNYCAGAGGQGGAVIVQEGVSVQALNNYQLSIGARGTGYKSGSPWYGNGGGTSTFLSYNASGGDGQLSIRTSAGNGADGAVGDSGYTSYTETTRYGGDGGGGGYSDDYTIGNGGNGGADTGAKGGYGGNSQYTVSNGASASSNTGGGGGGGGFYIYRNDESTTRSGGNGGSGIVCIRMHLKVTS